MAKTNSRTRPLLTPSLRRASAPPTTSAAQSEESSRRPIFLTGSASARELPTLCNSTEDAPPRPSAPVTRSLETPVAPVHAKHTKTFDTKLPNIKCVNPRSSYHCSMSERKLETPPAVRRAAPSPRPRAATLTGTAAVSGTTSVSHSFEHASYRKARVGDLIAECAKDYYADMRKPSGRHYSHSNSDVMFAMQHGTIRV